MKILKVKVHERPEVVEVEKLTLEWMQEQVGGWIQAVYPFDDPVALICDEEGKLKGKELNRELEDDDGNIYDILCGDFLVVGLGEEDFCGLSDELIEKYSTRFQFPRYIHFDNESGLVSVIYAVEDDDEKNN